MLLISFASFGFFGFFEERDLFGAFGVAFDLGLEIAFQFSFLFLKLLILLNKVLTLFQQFVIALEF